jgi:uncharacterized protein
MFRSRTPKSFLHHLRDFFWPSLGWRRYIRYLKYRVIRLKDSTYSVTCGFASGAAVSFTPIPGTHFIQAAGLAYLLKGNVLAGLAGTLVGNPWTFPLMWWLAYSVGKYLFILFGFPIADMPAQFEWSHFWHEVTTKPMDLILPWLAGGYVLCLISWPFFYLIFHWLIDHVKNTQELWRRKKLTKKSK